MFLTLIVNALMQLFFIFGTINIPVQFSCLDLWYHGWENILIPWDINIFLQDGKISSRNAKISYYVLWIYSNK